MVDVDDVGVDGVERRGYRHLSNPTEMLEALRRAIERRELQRTALDEMVKSYQGPFFDSTSKTYTPRNLIYRYVSMVVPRLAFENPEVQVTSRKAALDQRFADLARTVDSAMESWLEDVQIRNVASDVAYDYLFIDGAVHVGSHPRTGSKDPLYWPVATRISPMNFVVDHQAQSVGTASFMAHRVVMLRSELEELVSKEPDAGWVMDAVKNLSSDDEEVEKFYRTTGAVGDKQYRDEVSFWEIWTPYELDPNSPGPAYGFNGTYMALSLNMRRSSGVDGRDEASWLREPRAASCEKGGPYAYFGAYTVPNNPYCVSPLAVTESQRRAVVEELLSLHVSMRKRKRIGIGRKGNDVDVSTMKNADDGDCVLVHSDPDTFVEREFGGPTQQMLNQAAITEEWYESDVGLDNAGSGVVTGDASASENVIADASRRTRFGYVEDRFYRGMSDLLRKAMHILIFDERVAIPTADGRVYFGGLLEAADVRYVENLELEIVPGSMARRDAIVEGARQAQVLNGLPQVLPLIAQFPDWPWSLFGDSLADLHDMPVIKQLFGQEVVQAVAMRAQAQLEAGMPQPQPVSSQPSIAPVVGRQMGMVPSKPQNYGSPPRPGNSSRLGSRSGPDARAPRARSASV
jgi:hypothetical protein